jgi:hypothetical protein
MNSIAKTPSTPDPAANWFFNQLGLLALFFIIVAFGSAILMVIFRSGLPIPWRLIVLAPMLFVNAVLLPFLLPTQLRQRCLSKPAIIPVMSFGMLALPVLEFPFGPMLGWIHLPLAISALYRARGALKTIKIREALFCALAAPLFCIYLFATYNQLGYATIYSPEIALTIKLNYDSNFHTAIAHIFQNYGRIAPGFDGFTSIHYHYFSHIWFAAMSSIGQTSPLFSYPICQLVITIPFLFWAVSIGALLYAERNCGSCLSLIAAVIAIAIFIDQVGWRSYYISESFTISLGLLLCILPLLYEGGLERMQSVGDDAYRVLITLLLSCVALGLKISVGFLWGAAVGYVALIRYPVFRISTLAYLACLGAILLLGFYIFHDTTALGGNFELFYMFRNGSRYVIFASLFVPILAGTAALWKRRLRNSFCSKRAAAKDLTLGVRVVAWITLVSMIPGSIMVLLSGAWWYFLNVSHWVALPLLVSQCIGRRQWLAFKHDRFTLPFAAFMVAFGGWLLWPNGIQPDSILRVGLSPVMALAQRTVEDANSWAGKDRTNPNAISWTRLAHLSALFPTRFADTLIKSPGAIMEALVEEGSAGDIKNFAVYVPPTNDGFWTITPTPWCGAASMLIPSLTGVPMILGLPPLRYGCTLEGYGFSSFPNAESRAVSNDVLCQHAVKRDMKRVFVLRSLTETAINEVISCGR